MEKRKFFSISFVTEKVAEHGEDAPPLLIVNDSSYTVGVFDGMGGSGATLCNSQFGEGHTKAYVASRLVKNAVEKYIKEQPSCAILDNQNLKEVIIGKLHEQMDDYPEQTRSMLRSSLLLDYPTTMALTNVTDKGDEWQIDVFGAGDSRCYMWTADGFSQISKDDLSNNIDPMENLSSDAPMSNCISASQDFHINQKTFSIAKKPTIFLSASDGCFGYYPTPMDFEHILRKCLRKSKNEKMWEDKVKKDIQKVTGDDTSISLICVGFSTFNEVKKLGDGRIRGMSKILQMRKTIEKLRKKHLRNERQMKLCGETKRIRLKKNISRLEKTLIKIERKTEEMTRKLWNNYKKENLRYIMEDNYGDAKR